jgi:hypothetical protein
MNNYNYSPPERLSTSSSFVWSNLEERQDFSTFGDFVFVNAPESLLPVHRPTFAPFMESNLGQRKSIAGYFLYDYNINFLGLICNALENHIDSLTGSGQADSS